MTRVQASPRATATNTLSVALTFTTPPTTGNGVVVLVTARRVTASAPTTCTDNRGNTYVLAYDAAQGLAYAGIFYCSLVYASAAPFTITVTSPGLLDWQAFAVEVGGLGGDGLLFDGSARGGGTTSDPTTATLPSLTGPDSFQAAIHSIAAPQTSITLTSEAGTWLVEFEELAEAPIAGEAITRVVASSAGTTPLASWADSTLFADWAAVLVAFRTAGTTTLPPVGTPRAYYPIVGSQAVNTQDGPFYYGPTPDAGSYAYVRGPWDKRYGGYSYGTWWKLYPHQMTDSSPNTQVQSYQLPLTPTPYRWHLASHITPRLKAQTLGGTFDLILGVHQSHADCVFGWRVVIWVSQGRYFLPERGLALDYTEPPGRPWPLVATGWGLPTPQALAPIEVQDGDYLSVEIGIIAYNQPGVSRSSYIDYATVSGPLPAGVPNPPLTVGSTATLSRAGRMLFSQPLALLDPPASDVCATPITIATLPWEDAPPLVAELATYDATTDLPVPTFADAGLYNTVWWVWTAPVTGTLRLETYTGNNPVLVVYTGSCGALTQVASGTLTVPFIKLPVTAGTTYHIRVGGRFHLSATHPGLQARMVVPPVNDHFANRIVITLPYTEASDMTLATAEAGEPLSPTDWTDTPAQSIWYEWTADAAAGHVRVDTTGSDFDSQITVWTRVPLSTFPVPPATDYYDAFNLPDRATLFNPWSPATSWGGVSLGIAGHRAVSAQVAPLQAGNYFNNGESYGLDVEFWALLTGDFPSIDDWAEIDAYTSANPSTAGRNGYWVGAKRDGAGYHAQLGRYSAGVSTTLTTATSAVPITGIGFRRLGTTLYLWVQRAGVWGVEYTTPDATFATSFLRPAIGLRTAAPGNVAFDTVGGSTLCPWLGDLWIEVFSAPWTNTADEAEYSDQANMVFRPTVGVTYYITVFSGGRGTGAGRLSLTISRVTPVPSNETCATALAITTIPAYFTTDITNAADGQMELVPLDDYADIFTMAENDSGKVLWYKWTADRSEEMNYNTFGSGWYGPFQEVALYRGVCGALEPLLSNSFNFRYEATQLFFTAELGTTYYWRVTSQGRISGPVYFFLDVHHTTWQEGDVIVGDDWVFLFAASGAARLRAPAGGNIPTGSGIDPETGLLYVATFFGHNVRRYGPRLQALGSFPVAPGQTPEVPGFFANGALYVGHWGNYATLEGNDGLVDPSFAIRQFDPDTGALVQAFPAKQENDGTAWIDPAADQATIHYTSRGRKILAYDIANDLQLPDVARLVDEYPTYRARGLRHRENGEILVADAAEVKRVSATGTVLQRYPIDARDDLNVLDQDPAKATMWVGDQDTSEVYRVDIASGAVLLKIPGGHLGAPFQGAGHLCGLTVVEGYRAGAPPPEPPLEPVCIDGTFPIDVVAAPLCVTGAVPVEPGSPDYAFPPEGDLADPPDDDDTL